MGKPVDKVRVITSAARGIGEVQARINLVNPVEVLKPVVRDKCPQGRWQELAGLAYGDARGRRAVH
jgi:hypothetical protein